jgi:hypothetical protein
MATSTPEEKRTSDNGSNLKDVRAIHYVLDERRRAALAEIDNAKFSYVAFPSTFSSCLTIYTQMVPRQSVRCRWRRVLY